MAGAPACRGGFEVARQVAVPDTGPAIQQAVREALARSDFIIVTGGLGPTSDNLTRELIAALLGQNCALTRQSSPGSRTSSAVADGPR